MSGAAFDWTPDVEQRYQGHLVFRLADPGDVDQAVTEVYDVIEDVTGVRTNHGAVPLRLVVAAVLARREDAHGVVAQAVAAKYSSTGAQYWWEAWITSHATRRRELEAEALVTR